MKWIKFAEKFPPPNGTLVLIAMRNKNMGECGIWLYDICGYYGGDISDNDNWDGKANWELPIYWAHIEEPK